MKTPLLLAFSVCFSLLGANRVDAEPYAPAEKDLQKIIPLYEYKELDYLARLSAGVAPAKAKTEANAVVWNPASPLIGETAHFLSNAKIVIINYALLKQDFPFLAPKTAAEIDQWVLDKAAYIAKGQVDKGVAAGVNTEIPNRADKVVTAFRPYTYGRALLFPVTDSAGAPAGFIDVKGAGARDPRNQAGGHSNGLMALGECIREYNYENLVNRVLVHANKNGIVLDGLPTATPTVGSYAVIYAGFAITPGGAPAGLYLRQAHTRWNPADWDHTGMSTVIVDVPAETKEVTGAGHMLHDNKVKLAKILALYNIWADEFESAANARFMNADVQGTRDNRLFDFGAYLGGANLNDNLVFAAAIPNFAKAKAVPFEQWGWEGGNTKATRDPGKDRPWIWAHETANSVVRTLAGDYRSIAGRHFDDMVKNPLIALGIWE